MCFFYLFFVFAHMSKLKLLITICIVFLVAVHRHDENVVLYL